MDLTLYHSVESTCAQKVRIVMAIKNLQWREIRLNLRKGEQFAPDYLRLNPKAVVPTLLHNGLPVRESSVINEYLDDCFPAVPLRPGDSHDRARMRLLVKSIDDEVHPAIGVLSYAIFLRHQMDQYMSADELEAHFKRIADPARRERQQATHFKGLSAPAVPGSIQALQRFVGQLDESLTRGQWLAGDEFSLADAAAIPYMFRARALELAALWQSFDRVRDWFDAAVERAVALPLDEVFGSDAFHAMVAEYAARESGQLAQLLESSRCK